MSYSHNAKAILALCFLSALTMLASIPAISQQEQTFHDLLPQPRTPAELSDYEQKLLTITLDWSRGTASTPGTSVDLREVLRTTDQGKLMVQYHVFVKGAPQNQLYTSFQWPVTDQAPSESTAGLTLAQDGLVLCAGRTPDQCSSPTGKDDPVEFTFVPERGEIFRLALVSADQKTKVFFAVVPNPLLNKDKGCLLEAVRLTPQFEVTMLRGKGYKPNESLHFIYKSYDETHDLQVIADAKGEFVFSLSPFAKGKHGGKGEAKVKGSSCAPAISFDWGNSLGTR